MLAKLQAALFAVTALAAAADLPPSEENAIVKRYCAGCHSDKLNYGLMTLEHFDGAHVDPSLAAMLLSKITNGHTAKDVNFADDAAVRALMQRSAMGAAGLKTPDDATQVAFARSLAAQAGNASHWNVVDENHNFTASILREKPRNDGSTDSYRLTISCAGSGAGEVKLAWANSASKDGTLMAVRRDDAPASTHTIDGNHIQGDGGIGATVLKIPLPGHSLTVSNIFGEGDVEFSFDSLSANARNRLATCFQQNAATH